MSLAWLLFFRSLQYSWRRLALVIGAVGLGVAILFLFTAGYNGLTSRMNHVSWKQNIFSLLDSPQTVHPGVQPLYVLVTSGSNVDSTWRDKQIEVTEVVASDQTSPKLLGLPTPLVGEYYVSSGLQELINTHPEDKIGTRFGTKLLGVIPDQYITSPDELVVIRGVDIATVKRLEQVSAPVVKLYSTDNIAKTAVSPYSKILMTVLYLGIFILLFPIMILIATAIQLGSRQREERYASLRLVGATRAQVRLIMMVESSVASVVGILFGNLLYLLLRPLVIEFKFQDMRFWPEEVEISAIGSLIIIVATLLFTICLNLWAIRHVQVSPLGIPRKGIKKRGLYWWRLVPLILSLGALVLTFTPILSANQGLVAIVILATVVVLMFGLVIAGPYITQKIAQLIAKFTQRASVLLGMKYIAYNARGVFRSVSGVVVALFAGSFLLVCTSGVERLAEQSVANNGYSTLKSDTVLIGSYVGGDYLPDNQKQTLEGLDYVKDADQIKVVSYSITVMTCSTAARYTTIECPQDREYVAIDFTRQDLAKELYGVSEADVYRQISSMNPYFTMDAIAPNYLVHIEYADTDKLRSFIAERYMKNSFTNAFLFNGTDTNKPYVNPIIEEFASLAYVGIGITVLVAVVGLMIATIGGLLERRKSLVTLRLSGMTVGDLRRIVIIESLIPLLSVTIVAASFGLAVGSIMMYRLTETIHSTLSVSYLVLFIGCVVAAVVSIFCLFPTIRRIANIDKVRTE